MRVDMAKPFIIFLFFVLGNQSVWAQELESNIEPEAPLSSDLGQLEPYKNIAVIQKKFFPKTERWEFFISGLSSLNNKLFTSLGAKANLSYHFSERWSIEGQLWFLGQISRDFTENIENRYQIASSDLVTPQGYAGVNLVWSPIYGKLSLFESTINPFELYFSFGGGLILTDDSQTAPAVHAAIGQIHPISTQTTIRWEIGGNVFQAEGKGSLAGDQRGQKVMSEIIYVSLGVSFYFPEVERR